MVRRRHPIVTIIVVATVILALFSFSKSFEASSTLSKLQRVLPSDSEQKDLKEVAEANKFAEAQLANENSYEENYRIEGDYITPNEVIDTPEKANKIVAKPADDKAMQVEANLASLKDSEIEKEPKEVPKKKPEIKAPDTADLTLGTPIMGKMPNQTVRAEVGRAGWKLIHTILSQFPEEPTQEDKDTLLAYFKLLSRVYPCQECAWHFQDLLRKSPPQLSSRKTAVMWGCDAHNKVNKRLGKEIFDCAYIFDKYDCGCGDQVDEKSELVPGEEGFETATNRVPVA